MAEPAELIRRIAQSQDAAAERELCLQFAPRVRLYGMRHLRDETAAAALVQQVLLSVLQAAREGRIDAPEQLHRFVLETCRKLAAEVPRKPCSVEVLTLPPEVSPVDASRLATCFGMAGARDQRVLTRTFQDGHVTEEIATEFSLPIDDVRRIRRRVIAAVRRCVEGATA